jgi:replicative DNA helicase
MSYDALIKIPNDARLEQSVIGTILSGRANIWDITQSFKPEYFFDVRHQVIFGCICRIVGDGQVPDLLNIDDRLRCEGVLENAGGTPYLSSLADPLNVSSDLAHIGFRLRTLSVQRRALHVADNLLRFATESQYDFHAILDQTVDQLSELGREMDESADEGISYFEAASQKLAELRERNQIKVFTGVEGLDKLTGGFRPGELVIVTGETGGGKTLFAQQTRKRNCQDGRHALYCSGEMFARHLLGRELAADAGVRPSRIRRDDCLTGDDWNALIEAATHQCKICRILDGSLNFPRIRRSARRMKTAQGLSLLVLDYDELIDINGKDELDQQRNLVRAAKSLGMELDCAVLVVSQLRKSPGDKDIARPTLQNIYGSGAKIKHASIVIFADRPYVRELKGNEKSATLYVLKNRDGKIGAVSAVFNIDCLRFSDAPRVQPKNSGRDHTERREEGGQP